MASLATLFDSIVYMPDCFNQTINLINKLYQSVVEFFNLRGKAHKKLLLNAMGLFAHSRI